MVFDSPVLNFPISLPLLASKRSIVKIKDDGTNTCLACAIVVGQALQEKQGNELTYMLKNRNNHIEPLASGLHKRAGIREGTLCGIEVLTNYRLVLISREHCYSCIFKGPDKPRTMCLHLARDHYDVIRSMSGFLNRSNFCDVCQKGYNDAVANHVCNISCKLCYSMGV